MPQIIYILENTITFLSVIISLIGCAFMISANSNKNSLCGEIKVARRMIILILSLNTIIACLILPFSIPDLLFKFITAQNSVDAAMQVAMSRALMYNIYGIGVQLFFVYYIYDSIQRFNFCTLKRIIKWRSKNF